MEKGIGQLVDMVAKLRVSTETGFKKIDERFEKIEQKLDSHDQKFKSIDQRFDEIDKRFEKVDQRFDEQDAAIAELKCNQEKILESIEILTDDTRNNRLHIMRLEKDQKII